MDEHMPAHLKMHEFLKSNSWTEPTSTSNNPYTYAHDTNGKSMWEYLSERPTRMASFNDGMTLQAMTELWMIDLFPWESLSDQQPTPTTVVAVDIGGGTGMGISRIRSYCCSLPGKFILQDQAHVIQSADPRGNGIEKMAYDFFEEQPIRGKILSHKPGVEAFRHNHISPFRSSYISYPPLPAQLASGEYYPDPEERRRGNAAREVPASH